jgi:L-threonylcarbamoyladenylate synthase
MSSLKNTVVLKVDPARPERKAILAAAKIIRLGGLVAFPTETVYGLAANCADKKAMARLCRVKKRPEGKPFTVHISGSAIIRKMGCRVTGEAKALMDKYWPGPLTLVLPAKGGKKIGFRMPANKVALELIKISRVPVAAPSANLSGSRPPVKASDVLKELDGKIDMLIDAGKTDVGVESTVIDMTVKPFKVLREGAIKEKAIRRAVHNG